MMEDKPLLKRILYISPLPPPAGGIAAWTQQLLAKGLPGGYHVDVLDIARRFNPGKLSIIHEMIRTTAVVGKLVGILFSRRVSVVHLNTPLQDAGIYRDFLCAWIAKLFGKPLVTNYRCDISYFMAGRPRFKQWVAAQIFKMSDVNLVLNTSSYQYIWRETHVAPTVIGNFIEDEKALVENPPRGLDGGNVVGLFVGHVCAQKGCDLIVEVARQYPDITFQLVGKVINGFEAVAKTAPPNVKFFDEVGRNQIFDFYRHADFFLFPTLTEGFPNAVLEAMASSLPIVATNVGAIPDMVDAGQGGVLFSPGSPDEVSRALQECLAKQSEFYSMGRHNQKKVQDNYTYSMVTGRLVAIYERLINGGEECA